MTFLHLALIVLAVMILLNCIQIHFLQNEVRELRGAFVAREAFRAMKMYKHGEYDDSEEEEG